MPRTSKTAPARIDYGLIGRIVDTAVKRYDFGCSYGFPITLKQISDAHPELYRCRFCDYIFLKNDVSSHAQACHPTDMEKRPKEEWTSWEKVDFETVFNETFWAETFLSQYLYVNPLGVALNDYRQRLKTLSVFTPTYCLAFIKDDSNFDPRMRWYTPLNGEALSRALQDELKHVEQIFPEYLSYKQIADLCGVTPETVRRTALRQHWRKLKYKGLVLSQDALPYILKHSK